MIYSKSADYAIRAAIHLAQLNEGEWAMAREVAETEEIPAPFLSKILQDLARKGLFHSVKGPSGGFRLKGKAASLRLIDVIEAVDGIDAYELCICGSRHCTDKTPCPLRDSWKPVQSRIMVYLERNTIGGLVKSMTAKAKGPKQTSESRKHLRSSV